MYFKIEKNYVKLCYEFRAEGYSKPWQLLVEKRQFFSENKHWINNIVYH